MRRSFVSTLLATGLILVPISRTIAGGVGISTERDTVGTGVNFNISTDRFYPLRGGGPGSLARRDIEFQWDSLYTSPGTGERGMSGDDILTLHNLGDHLATEAGHNPFGANLTDLRLVYEYFRSNLRPPYDPDPQSLQPFVAGDWTGYGLHWNGASFTQLSAPLTEFGHVDAYVYLPNHDNQKGGRFPSWFLWETEDSLTGHWHSPSDYEFFSSNSIMSPGPVSRAQRLDVAGTGWTAHDKAAVFTLDHEFQHSLRDSLAHALTIDEIFSSAAEALGLPPGFRTTDCDRIPPSREDPACGRASSRMSRSSPSFARASARA